VQNWIFNTQSYLPPSGELAGSERVPSSLSGRFRRKKITDRPAQVTVTFVMPSLSLNLGTLGSAQVAESGRQADTLKAAS